MPLRKIPISYQILEKAPGAYACFLKGFLSFFKLDFICDFWYSVLYGTMVPHRGAEPYVQVQKGALTV
jgi:hypothetical protein